MSTLPKVVIVGRTNIGKSTLFNRLSTNVKSLTLDYEGVTRDFINDTVCWKDKCFELIDSGGITLKKVQDPLGEKVRLLGLQLVEVADIILFMVDGTIGFLPEDRAIGEMLHKSKKKVMLVVNKIDNKLSQEHLYEFQQAHFEHTIAISAQHGLGIDDLLETLIQWLPAKTATSLDDAKYNVILLGKPNVGKSSLLNLMLEEERALVSEQAGTTREAITESLRFYQETIAITDTPGIRRKRAVGEHLEQMMVKSSFRALDHAHIVLLMVDASEAKLSDQELKLAFYAFEHGKALIILFNKEDMLTEQKKADLLFDLDRYKFFLRKIPQLYISCATKKNVGKILPLVQKIWQRYNQRFDDLQITMLFKDALSKTPLYHQSTRLIVFEARQIASAPITILLKVSQPKWFGESQRAFFENILRKHYDLEGVPVLFVIKKYEE